MTVDQIAALETLGYTEREASFLYLVASHSGYFLRRQFCRFIERKKGWIAQRFIEKARLAGHIEIIDYGQGRYVYHLFSRPIYRLFGNEESQSRHRKGDHEIRARLMALDYVLENQSDHYLELPSRKLEFFVNVRRVPSDVVKVERGYLHPFVANFPISVADPAKPATSLVRFAFIDQGLLSLTKFNRFLYEIGPLMLAVKRFEVVYTALSSVNFARAEDAFRKRFEAPIKYGQRTFDEFAPGPRRQIHSAPPVLQARFTRLLFRLNYPQLMRTEPQGSVPRAVPGSALVGEIA